MQHMNQWTRRTIREQRTTATSNKDKNEEKKLVERQNFRTKKNKKQKTQKIFWLDTRHNRQNSSENLAVLFS